MISWEELDRHNKEEGGSWLVVHGRVYDTCSLTKRAPCEAEKLAELVGRDATKAFDAVGHSPEARDLMDQCYVGIFKEVGVVYG